MTEKVGGIEYDIDADASGVVTAGKSVKEVSGKMEADFKKVDLAVDELIRKQKALGRTVNDSGQVFNKSGKEIKGVTAKLKSLIAQQKSAKASTEGLADSQQKLQANTKDTAKGLGGMGRKAGMAGVQIEQFVGSVQGGQDAMRAFSFQATDMGIVLGVPLVGAAIGLTTALVSALMPALFNSGKEVDSLKEKLQELAKTTLLTSDQAAFLAGQEKKSQEEKKKAIAKLEKEIKAKEKSIATDKASIETASQLLKLRKGQSAAEQKSQLNNSIKKTSESLLKLKADLSLANTAYDDAAVKLKAYDLIVGGNNKRTGEQTEAVKSLLSALNEQLRITGKNERALLEDTLARAGANDTEKAAALGKYDLIKAKEADIETSKKSKAQEDKLLASMIAVHASYKQQAAQLELNSKQLDEYNARKRLGLNADEQIPVLIQAEIDALESLRVKKAEMMEQDKANQVLEQEFKAIKTEQGLTDDPLVALQQSLDAEREIIKDHTDILLQNEKLTQDQRNAIIKQGEELRTGIENDAANNRKKIADIENKAKLNAVSQTFGALSSLMNTESKKLFEVGKAAAIAGAIVDGFAAVSKTMASVPYPFNIPLAAAQAVASAVQVQNIAKQKVGGAQTMGASGSFSGGTPVTNTQPQAQAGTNVNVSGVNPGDMFTGQQMMDTLRAVVGDGADVTFLTAG
jgi:hypothetical protein